MKRSVLVAGLCSLLLAGCFEIPASVFNFSGDRMSESFRQTRWMCGKPGELVPYFLNEQRSGLGGYTYTLEPFVDTDDHWLHSFSIHRIPDSNRFVVADAVDETGKTAYVFIAVPNEDELLLELFDTRVDEWSLALAQEQGVLLKQGDEFFRDGTLYSFSTIEGSDEKIRSFVLQYAEREDLGETEFICAIPAQ